MLRASLRLLAGLLFVVVAGGAASGAPTEQPAPPKCLKAEVNLVTGHVLCIDPLGAPVEPPPPEAKRPCNKPEDSRGQWSYVPNCAPQVEGM